MNKTSSILLFVFLLPISLLFGQEFIANREMKKIADKSSVGYEFNQLQQGFAYETLPVVPPGMAIVDLDNKLQMLAYREIEPIEIGALRADANRQLKEAKANKAKKLLQKIINLDPGHSEAMLFMGYAYELEKDLKSAKEWYQKAITTNPINYKSHQAMAFLLLKEGQADEALNAILRAHILNRNDETIFASLQKISGYNGLVYDDWQFVPQYELLSGEGGSVRIEYNGVPWKYYGLCQAIWDYEPGYRAEKRMTTSAFDLSEELECMTFALRSYDQIIDQIKVQVFPEFVSYKYAVSKRMGAEYLLYEIRMQQDPYISGLLNEVEMEDVVTYVRTVRLKKDIGIRQM